MALPLNVYEEEYMTTYLYRLFAYLKDQMFF